MILLNRIVILYCLSGKFVPGKDDILKKYVMVIMEYARLTVGTILMAMAVNFIYEPLNMVTGGISGLAIGIKSLSSIWIKDGIPVWVSNFVINIPIFIWGLKIRGKNFIIKTIYANTSFSLAMLLLPVIAVSQKDYIIAAIIGGVLTGSGLGLVFGTGYSTGGTDLLSSIINKYLPYYSVPAILFVIDAVIIAGGVAVFGLYSGLYAVVAVYISTQVMDFIIAGGKACKQIMIISDKYKEISDHIIYNVGRGVTVIDGQGVYTGENKKVLLCVVGKKELVKVTGAIRHLDDRAFIIISEIRGVYGEGFEQN